MTSGEEISSGSFYTSDVIVGDKDGTDVKSHHNVGGLPEDMQFKLIQYAV